MLAAYLYCPRPLAAQKSKPQEYEVKAAYLYNFGRFVEWPASGNMSDNFPICVLGQDPFGSYLDAVIAGEVVNDRKLIAKRIATVREALNCRILFISDSESVRVREILAAVDKTPVLTVSDTPNFIIAGGMIQFVVVENRIRFSINLAACERASLTPSSQLLKVAVEVRGEASKVNGPS
ncbi:MAG: YfiR family protein [Candidatus Acidiferrum sp.]|jgi:uncharacterized protein DUF4154